MESIPFAALGSAWVGAMGAWSWLAADQTTPVVGGAFGLLVILAGYLLRELNRSSGGAWLVVRDKNRELHRQRWEIAYWQFRANMGPDPGQYKEPTDKELKTW